MKQFGIGMILATAAATGAAAQQTAAPQSGGSTDGGCFHVSIANQGSQPNTAVRWNSCTGQSWLLLRAPVTDKSGKASGSVWAWFPVPVSDAPATAP